MFSVPSAALTALRLVHPIPVAPGLQQATTVLSPLRQDSAVAEPAQSIIRLQQTYPQLLAREALPRLVKHSPSINPASRPLDSAPLRTTSIAMEEQSSDSIERDSGDS